MVKNRAAKKKKKKGGSPSSSTLAPPPASSQQLSEASMVSPGIMGPLDKDIGGKLLSFGQEGAPKLTLTGGNIQKDLVITGNILQKVTGNEIRKNDKEVGNIGNMNFKWANLFKDNRSAKMGAPLTRITLGVSSSGIEFGEDEFEEDEQVSTSLIGFFSPKFPGLDAIQKLVGTWVAKCTIHRHASTWIVFTFATKEDAGAVLDAGPYQSFGSSLHLRSMPKFFSFGREAQSEVPVWAQLPNLPLDLWKPKHLSKLCTFIGTPLHTDKLTETRERISFARVLVQVKVEDVLPESLPITLPGGIILNQPVLYENKPVFCEKCKRLGHAEIACRDLGKPVLYTMRKPLQQAAKKKKKINVSSTSDWVEKGKNYDTVVSTPVTTTVMLAPVIDTVVAPVILTEVAPVIETTVVAAADSSGSVTLGTKDSSDEDEDFVQGSENGSEDGSEDGDKKIKVDEESEENEEGKKDEKGEPGLHFIRDIWESPNNYRRGSGQVPQVTPLGYRVFTCRGKWVMMKETFVPQSLKLMDDEATSGKENC